MAALHVFEHAPNCPYSTCFPPRGVSTIQISPVCGTHSSADLHKSMNTILRPDS